MYDYDSNDYEYQQSPAAYLAELDREELPDREGYLGESLVSEWLV